MVTACQLAARTCRGGGGARPPDSGATGGSEAAPSSGGASPAMLDRLERRGMRLPLEPGAGSGTGLPRPPSHDGCPDAISSSPACGRKQAHNAQAQCQVLPMTGLQPAFVGMSQLLCLRW